MQDNPYARIIKVFRMDRSEQTSETFELGTVMNTLPLKINVSTLDLGLELFLKNSAVGDLYPGDLLLLVPIEDAQRFIILCKVVSL